MLYESSALLELSLAGHYPIIPNLMGAGDKILLYASADVGKSILSQQIASCVAGGMPFLDFPTPTPQPTLYIAGENDLEELQERGRAMHRVLPVLPNHLFYWPLPEYLLDTPSGSKQLQEAANNVKALNGKYPLLTVFDPAQALMAGKLSEDGDVRRFLRQVNLYQKYTATAENPLGSACIIVHHTHRPKRTTTGEVVDEEGMTYTGSQSWMAWPKLAILMTLQSGSGARVMEVTKCRSGAAPFDTLALSLVGRQRENKRGASLEYMPLCYVLKREGISSGYETVYWTLRVQGAQSITRLEQMTFLSHGTVTGAVHKFVEMGVVHKIVATPGDLYEVSDER